MTCTSGPQADRSGRGKANKAQIYHYFGSKDRLFDAVWEALVKQLVDGVPIDVDDLPEYAARLSQTYANNPELARLITWQRLEGGEDPPNAYAMQTIRGNFDAIAKASTSQRCGRLLVPMSSPSSTSQTLTSDARSSNLPSPLYWADRQPTRRHVRRDTSTSLSDLGRSLQPVVVALAAWGIETASSRSSSAACRRQIAPKNRRHKALKVTGTLRLAEVSVNVRL